jgi:hypothetical protein
VSKRTFLSVTTQATPQAPVGPQPPGSTNPVTITPPGTTTPVPIPVGAQPEVGGTIVLASSSKTSTKTVVKVDGGEVSSNGSLDTKFLTNGTHTVSITQDGVTASRTVTVANKLNLFETLRNQLFAGYHGNTKMVNATLLALAVLLFSVLGWITLVIIRGYKLRKTL